LFFEPIGGHKGPDDIKDSKTRNGINEKIRKGKYPERTSYLPHIPEKLRRTINQALSTSPDKRQHSASELIQDLSEFEICLDWQYRINGDEMTWSQETDSATTCITLLTNEGPCRRKPPKTRKSPLQR
jgi:eukaryotic-like serine/threonine-protein kinase